MGTRGGPAGLAQVFRTLGVFPFVADVATAPEALTVLETVRCLECGDVYAKPSYGGTVQQNPGCPS